MPASLALIALLAASPVPRMPPPRPSRLGLCAACHGSDGRATVTGAPNLAAQGADYLLEAMHQYRDGRRDNTVMRTVLGPLDAGEMEALARWYAAQTACTPVSP